MGMLEEARKFREQQKGTTLESRAKEFAAAKKKRGGALGTVQVTQKDEQGNVISQRTEPLQVVTTKTSDGRPATIAAIPPQQQTQAQPDITQVTNIPRRVDVQVGDRQDLVSEIADVSGIHGFAFTSQGKILGSGQEVVQDSPTQIVTKQQTVPTGKERLPTRQEIESGSIRAQPTERQGLLQLEVKQQRRPGFGASFAEGMKGAVSADPDVFARVRSQPIETPGDAGLVLGATLGGAVFETIGEIQRPAVKGYQIASEFADDILKIKTKSTPSIVEEFSTIRKDVNVKTPEFEGVFKKGTSEFIKEVVETPGVTTGKVTGVTFEGKPIKGEFFEFKGRQVISIKKPVGKKEFTVVSDIVQGVEDVKVFDKGELVFQQKRPAASSFKLKGVGTKSGEQFIVGEGVGTELKVKSETFTGFDKGSEVGLNIKTTQQKVLKELTPQIDTTKKITPYAEEIVGLKITPSTITREVGEEALKTSDIYRAEDGFVFERKQPTFERINIFKKEVESTGTFIYSQPKAAQAEFGDLFFSSKKGTLRPTPRLKTTTALNDLSSGVYKKGEILKEFPITRPFAKTGVTPTGLSGLSFGAKIQPKVRVTQSESSDFKLKPIQKDIGDFKRKIDPLVSPTPDTDIKLKFAEKTVFDGFKPQPSDFDDTSFKSKPVPISSIGGDITPDIKPPKYGLSPFIPRGGFSNKVKGRGKSTKIVGEAETLFRIYTGRAKAKKGLLGTTAFRL